MLYSHRGALTSSSVNSLFVFTTVVRRAVPRDQHAAVNYASKPRLDLEPAELNVWPLAADRVRTILAGTNFPFLHQAMPKTANRRLGWKRPSHILSTVTFKLTV